MNLATFLLILAILGIIIGILNKGARVIGFFVAMMAIVLLIGNTPGNPNSNFFTNLFNGNQTAQNPAAQAPTSTQPYYDPNTGTTVYPSATSSGSAGSNSNTRSNSNAGSTNQGSRGDLTSQPFAQPQTQVPQAQTAQAQPTTQPQALPGNTSTITNNSGSGVYSYPGTYPYTPPRRALW